MDEGERCKAIPYWVVTVEPCINKDSEQGRKWGAEKKKKNSKEKGKTECDVGIEYRKSF